MRRDLLSVLERPAVLKIRSNSGRSERMATGGVGQGGCIPRVRKSAVRGEYDSFRTYENSFAC